MGVVYSQEFMITANTTHDEEHRRGNTGNTTVEYRKNMVGKFRTNQLEKIEEMFDECRDENSTCPDDSISKKELETCKIG